MMAGAASEQHPSSCDCEFCLLDEAGLDEAGHCLQCGEQPLFEQDCACYAADDDACASCGHFRREHDRFPCDVLGCSCEGFQ